MERARRQYPAICAPHDPLALIVRSSNTLRLAALDAVGLKAGLAVGMTLADARARLPDLATLQHDPEADREVVDILVRRMIRFTPMVTRDPPDGLLMDISGCAHLFGGEQAMIEKMLPLVEVTPRFALADNAAAARALARYGDGNSDIAALPVRALELDDNDLQALLRAGLRRIGDLTARPLSAIAARFGAETVTKLRQMMGEVASPIDPHIPAAPIRVEARFAEPIGRTDDVLDVIEGLLGEAGKVMEARALGGRVFVATLYRSDGLERSLAVETGRPVRDPPAVIRLLRERIEGLADPIDPGFGFDMIALAVPRTEALALAQIGLDGADECHDGAGALVDRLGVRLGLDRVRRAVPCDRHLPEVAQQWLPAAGTPAPEWPATGNHPPRPLFLLDPPHKVEVIAEVPDGPPYRFRWKGKMYRVTLAEGPERLASEWWTRAMGHFPNQGGLTRDYYRVEDEAGRRFWIFRHGLFGEKGDPDWYLHGLFP